MSHAEGHRFRGGQRSGGARPQNRKERQHERGRPGHREPRNLAPRIGADARAGRKDESILYCAGPMLNPLRSEAEMFRLLLYVIVVFAVIIALILIIRAIT
jgi:hypothetical protein